jgi:hypothetical protein
MVQWLGRETLKSVAEGAWWSETSADRLETSNIMMESKAHRVSLLIAQSLCGPGEPLGELYPMLANMLQQYSF